MELDQFDRMEINAGAALWAQTPGALLLDVRTPEEYREGHLPGSQNLPLPRLDEAAARWPDRARPIFVYCRSGARSLQAARHLTRMGYRRVTDIGGLLTWQGEL